MGFLDDLKDKIEDREINLSVDFDDVEIKFPFTDTTIIRLDGKFGFDGLKIGWGKRKEKRRGQRQGKNQLTEECQVGRSEPEVIRVLEKLLNRKIIGFEVPVDTEAACGTAIREEKQPLPLNRRN